MTQSLSKKTIVIFTFALFLGTLTGAGLGYYFSFANCQKCPLNTQPAVLTNQTNTTQHINTPSTIIPEENAVINVVKTASPAVVSIIVSKDLPKMEKYLYRPFGNSFPGYSIPMYRQEGYEKKQIGGGTGFIVTKDGYIATNRHVVEDSQADYTVIMNNKKYYQAKVVARYKLNDVAILKIEGQEDFPIINLGDSDNISVGQTVIAIGNSLGEFQNTVSKGVVSGLSRSLAAQGSVLSNDFLYDMIQTDTAINLGNSGGPLLDLQGKVIGINTAIVYNSQNIGFAIPINAVKNIIENVARDGKLSRAYLGVRYINLNQENAKALQSNITQGALIMGGRYPSQTAVMPDSPAEKAGLKENDIIIKVNQNTITESSPLFYLISRYQPGETITLTILRDGIEQDTSITLEEMK